MEKITRYFVGIFTIFASGLFVFILAGSLVSASPSNGVAGNTHIAPHAIVAHAQSVSTSSPAYLTIPSLSLHAKVQKVGVTKNGNMAVPTNFTDVGWYKYGTIPGHIGSAVIDGHVDNALALDGVFKHLEDVSIGDDIYVTAEDGSQTHFVVSRIDTFDYKDAPLDLIFHEHDKALLRLITCAGNWVQKNKMYDSRLMITAVLR